MDTKYLLNILTWAIIIVCSVIVFVMQYRAFGTSGKTRSIDSVSSFFFINEIVDKWQRAVFATIASVPLSFIFLIVAYRGEVFIKPLLSPYGMGSTSTNSDEVSASFFEELLKHIPEPLLPIAILILLFLVFGAQVKFLYQRIEKGIIYLAAISQRTNSTVRDFTKHLLAIKPYNEIVLELEDSRGNKLPLAEELEEATDETKLSFQLLHMAKFDIQEIGLRDAFRKIVNQHLSKTKDINSQFMVELSRESRIDLLTSKAINLRWFHVFISGMLFIIICSLYVGIVPSASEFFEERNVEWPQYQSIGSLVQTVAQMAFATILPMVMGIFLFVRRAERGKETVIQTVAVVVVIVFLSSLAVNAPVAFLQRLEVLLGIGELKPTTESGFGGRAELLYVFSHSLIPCFTVMVFAIVDPEETLSIWDIIVTVAVVTAGHFAAYAVFERVSGVGWNFYWHQALLAAVLGISALGIMRIFWRAPLQPRNVDEFGGTVTC